jgi:hypothetical protein
MLEERLAACSTDARGRGVPASCRHTRTLFVWLISHQSAVLFSQNKPVTSNQPAVLFSQNKSAPAINHQPNEQGTDSLRPARVKKSGRLRAPTTTSPPHHHHYEN